MLQNDERLEDSYAYRLGTATEIIYSLLLYNNIEPDWLRASADEFIQREDARLNRVR